VGVSGVNIKFQLQLVFYLDGAATQRNRLDAKLRLLQLCSTVIMFSPARDFQRDVPFCTMQFQRSRNAIMLSAGLLNA
jgi:hypothetical protein